MTENAPIAVAPAGRFRGVAEDDVAVWHGIRYALAPTGELRWRDPVAAPAASGLVDALEFGPTAPQLPNPAIPLAPHTVMDEDCLFVNVWAPNHPDTTTQVADADQHRQVHGVDGAPVMVWIHGGAYAFGSTAQPQFDGASFARAGGVVLVTLSYRLGALGFLDLTSQDSEQLDGNLALKDVLLALRWVQQNIAAFGGDPQRVTVFGESAGGGIVTTLLATPSAAGLFHRAIAESSPASSIYGRERAAEVAARFLTELQLPEVTAATLRAVPVAEVVRAGTAVFASIPESAPGTLAFAPVIDGDLVPEAPVTVLSEGRGLPVPLIIGTNRDEAAVFKFMKSPLLPITEERITQMFVDMRAESPDTDMPTVAQVRDAYEGVRHRSLGLGIARDIGFRMPSIWIAEGHSAVAPVWLYRFDHATPFFQLLGLGATHATELPYVWNNLPTDSKDPTFKLGGRRVARRIAARTHARWIGFATEGRPDAPDAPVWAPYDLEHRQTLVINTQDQVVTDLDERLRLGWGDTVLSFP